MTIRRLLGVLIVVIAVGISATAQQKKPARIETATFAGGCFWCMVPPFEALPGVVSVTSGYTGGFKKNPTYEEVSAGKTGHAESIQIRYNPATITYSRLLEVFWHNIDPMTPNRQFCDWGSQYRSAIFYHDDTQKRLAEESKRELEQMPAFKGKIVTEIVPLKEFYRAEEYHQDFYKKNPTRYHEYRTGCGRDKRLKELWGEQAGH
jgi:peptide-methionine (S)-S-oxide reductase